MTQRETGNRQHGQVERLVLFRRPAFGRHGNRVVAFFCTWEIVALIPGSPVPTISRTVELHPWFGWVLLALLGHHWFLELEAAVAELGSG